MKPVVFIDIDGTVIDSAEWWIRLYNIDHGTRFTKDDVKSYNFNDYIPGGLETYYHNYTRVEFVDGAYDALYRLRAYYRIVFVTAGFGAGWLMMNFPFERKDYVPIIDRSLLRGFALIDDCPDNLDVFEGRRYLLRQPWNTGRDLNDVTWKEVEEDLMRGAYAGYSFTN